MRNGGWDMQEDAVGGPYMSKGDQWIGWDDVDYVNKKASPVQAHCVKIINIKRYRDPYRIILWVISRPVALVF